jgi:DNA helicase TIP49 (TBP-interacting protein)
MYKLIALLLLASQFSFSQGKSKISTYKYGYNGMELIVSRNNEMIIISTFNSKLDLKEDIAQKVYDQFRNTKITTGDTLTIFGNDAKVVGKCEIQKKGRITAVNFYYESIEWPTGMTELYKKI